MWEMASPGGPRAKLGSAILVFFLAAQANAQGAPQDCRDLQGRPVAVETNKRIAYPAFATLDANGLPRIYWNPTSANGRSGTWRRFALLHECAHVLLHHIDRPPTTLEERRRAEREADCFAIQTVNASPGTSGSDMARLLADLGRTAGDATHLGGEELLDSLAQCLHDQNDERRWHTSLDQLMTASADSFQSITGAWLGESWAGTIHEATLDLPGTFSCEIRPPRSFVCLMVAAEDGSPAHRRFVEIRRQVEGWLPADWTSSDRALTTGSQAELFLAQSSSDGTFLALVRTASSRVYFVARPAGP
jgi:hypothetical protein